MLIVLNAFNQNLHCHAKIVMDSELPIIKIVLSVNKLSLLGNAKDVMFMLQIIKIVFNVVAANSTDL